MFGDAMDREFYREKIEGFCPPLVELPWKS